jgi:L-amino acid N-acyltransferase YncA
MKLRLATEEDFEQIWPIFHEVVLAGDSYGYRPGTSKEEARSLWMRIPRQTYVAEEDGEVLGTYYLKSNQEGPGAHVCNCGYMVAGKARGRGLATLLCEHSQARALELGYQAMQFNFVAASNTAAVRVWTKLGFETVGRLPRAFRHPEQGLVDALVMYKWLEKSGQ